MSSSETLVEAALRVLNTADPVEKARLGDEVANKWLQGLITQAYDPSQDVIVPDRPARLSNVSDFLTVMKYDLVYFNIVPFLLTVRRNASMNLRSQVKVLKVLTD